jgi:hypothetical protein
MGVLCGAGIAASAERGRCSLADAGVTALALAGVAASLSMQGRALVGPGALDTVACEIEEPPPQPYTAAEEHEVAQRLRALGYLP